MIHIVHIVSTRNECGELALCGVYAGQVDEASPLGGYVNPQNYRYWYAEKHTVISRLPLLNAMVNVSSCVWMICDFI